MSATRAKRLLRVLEAAKDELLKSLGSSGRMTRSARGLAGDGHGEIERRRRVEGRCARGQLEEDHPEGPDVGARVDVAAGAELLGGAVERRAGQDRGGHGAAFDGVERATREMPKERTLTQCGVVGARREEELFGREVLVDDAGAVGLGQGLADLEAQVDELGQGEGAAAAEERARSVPSRYSVAM